MIIMRSQGSILRRRVATQVLSRFTTQRVGLCSFENYFYFEKRPCLLQRWRFTCKFTSCWIVSTVASHNAKSSLVRFENIKYFLLLKKRSTQCFENSGRKCFIKKRPLDGLAPEGLPQWRRGKALDAGHQPHLVEDSEDALAQLIADIVCNEISGETNLLIQVSMLWSQFSAIFANFRRKNVTIHFAKLGSSLSKKQYISPIFLRKYF
jgi:hypothetical protein